MANLVLKYNAVVGKDPLPELQEITKRLTLAIDSVTEEKPVSGKRIKVVHVSGAKKNLDELGKEIIRFPAITLKKRK